MNCTRARGRYLTALGLTAVAGCRGSEPAATSAPTVTVESAAPAPSSAGASAQPSPSAAPKGTGAPAARHTGPWVPTVEVEAVPKLRPGLAVCPQGPFCVPQPAEAGSSPAAAPHQMCPSTMALPPGIGPTTAPGARAPSVSFDAARTTSERAGDPAACCYKWNVLCVGGRALRSPDGPITAASAGRDDWLAAGAGSLALPAPEVRAALARHWEREAAFEHASVAAFARASLSLLAVGAPPDLVAATHAAALDEVEHARLCYGLASAYGGAHRGPAPLALGGVLATPSLADLAVETFVDGCAGEAVAALVLREGAAAAADGAVRAILDRIAEDEERHAELAWRTVAFALDAGGDAVRCSLEAAAADLRAELAEGPGPARAEPDLSTHGVLDEAGRRAVRRRAIAEVVLPCVEALLSARASAPGRAAHAAARIT